MAYLQTEAHTENSPRGRGVPNIKIRRAYINKTDRYRNNFTII